MLSKGESSRSKNVFQVADRSLSRIINQRAIINNIYQFDGISRAQLAKDLGISKPTVTSNVERLIEIGLVEERGEGEATKKGGRKPVMLYFNKDHRYVGALDLSYRQPVCAISDLKNNIIGLKKIEVLEDASAELRREQVKHTFLEILQEHDIDLGKLDIIVISQPGIIEKDEKRHYSGTVHHVWTEIDLKSYLTKQLDVHVSLRNDVNMAAIGEFNFDCDVKIENLIYVSCGIGLGAGIIIDRKLYEGESNAAGEIGSLVMGDGQDYEGQIAMHGLIKRIEQKYEECGQPKKLTFTDVITLSKQKDVVVNEAIYEIGRLLGFILYNCCVVLNINTVKFGGDYLDLGDKLFEGIEDALKTRDIFKPKVMPSGLKQIAGIFGCFVVGRDKLIDKYISE